MSDRELRRLRKALSQVQSRQSGTSTRYPAAVRRQVLAYAQRRGVAGESVKSIARRLGIRGQLLAYWQKTSSRGRFQVVTVTAPAAVAAPRTSAPLVLVTSSGIRVEGLDVAGAAALVRELS